MIEREPEAQNGQEVLRRERKFPLRSRRTEGSRISTLVCPYELASDDSLELVLVDPKTAQITLLDEDKTFQRDLLVSQDEDKIVITMTGYLYNFPIKVSSWKDEIELPEEDDRAYREIVRKVEMEHVEGFEEAHQRHRERVGEMQLNDQSLDGALGTYEAILYSVPRY